MCTKSRAVTLGCDVNGSYDSNQLVKYSDLSPSLVDIYFYLEYHDRTRLKWYREPTISLLTSVKVSYIYTIYKDNDGNPSTFNDYFFCSENVTDGLLDTRVAINEDNDYWSLEDIDPNSYGNQVYCI